MRYFKSLIKFLLRIIGYKISPFNGFVQERLPFEYLDQKGILGGITATIFDVGAHNGQTSRMYTSLFNTPEIYAFEPFPESFEILKNAVAHDHNIKVFNLALGNTIGRVNFNVNKSSQTNSVLDTHVDSATNWDRNLLDTIGTIQIDSTTIDEVVKNNAIECIDILKLDTQGTEYQIIEGATNTIEQNKIRIIYLEIIIMPTYNQQKHFDEILLLLRNKGFRLYNFYNYSHTTRGELRQVDAIFIHESFKPCFVKE